MQPDRAIQLWVEHVFALYTSQPLILEQTFQEESHVGETREDFVTATVLTDLSKDWLPGVWAGSTLRYLNTTFPIVANGRRTLTVTGNLLATPPPAAYQIVPADIVALQAYLSSRTTPVQVSYSRIPATAPMVHIRLESDQQAPPYIGEDVRYTVNPVTSQEISWFQTQMEATYLLTIFTQNPQETVWLYTLLTNAYLGSQHYFSMAGLHNITMTGSDVHPDVAYLPEQVYARYMHLSFTRVMQAVRLDTIEQVDEVVSVPDPQYQELDSKMDPPVLGALWDLERWQERNTPHG